MRWARKKDITQNDSRRHGGVHLFACACISSGISSDEDSESAADSESSEGGGGVPLPLEVESKVEVVYASVLSHCHWTNFAHMSSERYSRRGPLSGCRGLCFFFHYHHTRFQIHQSFRRCRFLHGVFESSQVVLSAHLSREFSSPAPRIIDFSLA